MNKLLYIVLCCSAILSVISCKDEDRIRIPETMTGANMRIIVDPDHRQINYQTVNMDYFAFDAYSENTDLSSVEFTITWGTETKTLATFHQSDFADGNVRVELNANDFATIFNNPGFIDGSSGGNFLIKPKVTLNDGRVYPGWIHLSATDSISNLATSVIGSSGAEGAFTIQVLTAITCPPLDISGTYVVESAIGMSTDGCCPDESHLSGDIVEVTADNATSFSVSDITGGLYFEWYDVYGITGPDDTPGHVGYNCQEVNVINSPEPFGTTFQGSGTYDPVDHRITYSWFNGYGDHGDVVLVRQ